MVMVAIGGLNDNIYEEHSEDLPNLTKIFGE